MQNANRADVLPQAPPRAPAKRLTLDAVTKRYGHVHALDALSLSVSPGELVALLGPSGCGKTTTLRLIAGFEYLDAGVISIDEQDVSALPPNKRSLGMVFQNYSLFPHMTVGENISFGLRMAGASRDAIQSAVKRMLDLIRLPDYAERRIGQLSGGQQQRVALARAIVTDPSVLLLDEPLGALDKNLREGMQFEIRRLQQNLGITSVMVTHDQEEAMTMSDRVVVMSQGKILQSGAPREVYDRPRTRFVAEFLGTANVIACWVLARSFHGVTLALPAEDNSPPVECAVALPTQWSGELPPIVHVAIRPEKIVIDAPSDGRPTLRGRIVQHIFRGSQHSYEIDVPAFGKRVYAYAQATSSEHASHRPGTAVSITFSAADVVALAPEAPVETSSHAVVNDSASDAARVLVRDGGR
ncbi:ABC transporter ATP-binding protein [Pandoraea anhela]|uniref:Spermidine/putrescine import ATP-binding protein PotA n=1 Tax=Pandoraea anhela TaxID=2508295 RepID=A0A5E4YQN2_9BURK|nr:ABC transporter ATP-binding protein [Pandoraea anhela]VVE51091.1 Fe3+/spermidine/putrescine ABC transporter ATP-binding protein [Pandoraea anhela]